MITCTEAIANFNEHARLIEESKIAATNACIEDTKEWCNTFLSKLIELGSKRGDRRVILTVTKEQCDTRDCVNLVQNKVGRCQYTRVVHIPTIVRIAQDHGFTVKVQKEVKLINRNGYPILGETYHIEWA